MIVLIIAIVVSEYYARKARVVPMPSAPWMRKALLKMMQESAQIRNGERLYELGAGWGTLALALARQYPHAHITAIELSPIPFAAAWLRGKIGGHKNLSVKRASFYDHDLSKADVIVAYLTAQILADLKPKLEKEMKANAHMFCHTFPVPDWNAQRVETVRKMGYDLNVYWFDRQSI